MALLDPADTSPDPGELADMTEEPILWQATVANAPVYQLGSAPTGTSPAYIPP